MDSRIIGQNKHSNQLKLSQIGGIFFLPYFNPQKGDFTATIQLRNTLLRNALLRQLKPGLPRA